MVVLDVQAEPTAARSQAAWPLDPLLTAHASECREAPPQPMRKPACGRPSRATRSVRSARLSVRLQSGSIEPACFRKAPAPAAEAPGLFLRLPCRRIAMPANGTVDPVTGMTAFAGLDRGCSTSAARLSPAFRE